MCVVGAPLFMRLCLSVCLLEFRCQTLWFVGRSLCRDELSHRDRERTSVKERILVQKHSVASCWSLLSYSAVIKDISFRPLASESMHPHLNVACAPSSQQ